MINHFLSQVEEEGGKAKTFSPEAVDRLKLYDWPGNVRELENLIRRMVVLYAQDQITYDLILQEFSSQTIGHSHTRTEEFDISEAIEHYLVGYFQSHGDELPPSGLYHRILHKMEKPLLTACLTATRGNQLKASELLGLNRNTLRDKIRKLDIKVIKTSE